MATSEHRYSAPSHRLSLGLGGFRHLGNGALLLPVPVGFVVGIVSMLNGAGIGYAALQMMLFVLVCPLLFVAKYDDRYTATALLVSFTKIFFLSQIVCVLLLKAPDANLMRPQTTEFAIGVGMIASVLGIGAAALLFSATPGSKPFLTIKADAAAFRRLGYPTAAIGLLSQAVWTVFIGTLSGNQSGGIGGTVSGLALFSYLSPLALLSICCFAAARLIDTGGKSILSREFVAVLAAYLVLITPLASKAEPLKPIVAVAMLALVFRWRPPLAMIGAGLVVVVFVAEFLYPTITLARLRSFGEHRPLPIVFAETAMESVADPSNLAYVKAFTKNYDRSVRQFYYGKPMGFLDRFTPRVTDELVMSAEYNTPMGWMEFSEGAKALLPQTLGFKRNVTGMQRKIEAAFLRKSDKLGRVSWENSGFVGGGYLAGGAGMVAAYMFAFAFLSSVTARVSFGTRGGGILWIPFLVTFMLVPADMALSAAPPFYFWGWLVMVCAIAGLLKVFVADRRLARA